MKTARERAVDIVYGGLQRGMFKDDEQLVEAIECAIKAHTRAEYSIREEIENRLFWMGFDITNVTLTLPLQAVWTAVRAVELDLSADPVEQIEKGQRRSEHPPTSSC